MNCKRCGNVLNGGEAVCPNCGEPVNSMNNGMAPNGMQPNMGQPMANGMPGMDNGMGGMPTPQSMPQQSYQQMGQPMMNNMNNMNPGQPMGNNMNGGMGTNPGQPKKNMFLIIVIILAVAIAGLGGVIGYNLLSDNDTETKETDKDNKKDNKKDDDDDNKKDDDDDNKKDDDDDNKKDDDDDDDNPGGGSVASDNVFEYGEYVFTIPNGVKSVKEENLLTVSDGTTYQANFTWDYYVYSDIIADPTSILNEIKSAGLNVGEYKEITSNGRKFFCVAVSSGGNEGIFYFSDLDGESSVLGLILLASEDGLDKALMVVDQIADSAKVNSKFANEGTLEKVPTVDFSKLTEKKDI